MQPGRSRSVLNDRWEIILLFIQNSFIDSVIIWHQ